MTVAAGSLTVFYDDPTAFRFRMQASFNGTQILESNNQPVLLESVVGVHNGIVTNPEALGGAAVGSSADDAEHDSAVLFGRM